MIIVNKVENGPVLICPSIHKDDRGYFYESFNDKEFREKVCDTTFVQDNQSCSSLGVLRGMHFQTGEFAQAKLVRVVKGAVLDVVVDNRKESKNYGKYYEYLLTEENHYQLFIPRGFAHGFLCLRDGTIFQYKCDNLYNKESEDSFKYDSFGFDWSKYLIMDNVIVSVKDENAKPFDYKGIIEIPKDIILKEIEERSKLAFTMVVAENNPAYDNSYTPFKEDIYADVKNSKGEVSRAKLKYIGPYILDFSDIMSLNMGSRRIICQYDNGREFALSPKFEEVIRFYKYK
jgi:dTDP-4-dehydrorhamnose 3,5-epimerase